MDFVKELQRRIKKIDAQEKGTVEPKAPVRRTSLFKVKLYSLIKIQNGIRTRVGFGLTEDEAKVLSENLTRKMRKLPDLDESGGPLFEITLSEIRKED